MGPYRLDISCLNFWDEAWWFLSLRVFGLLSSSLLLFPQRFGRYIGRNVMEIIHIYIYIYICVCVCVCVCMNIFVYLLVYTRIFIYTYVLSNIYIYMCKCVVGSVCICMTCFYICFNKLTFSNSVSSINVWLKTIYTQGTISKISFRHFFFA